MACNVSKFPLLRAIAKRGYSASVCPRPVGEPAIIKTQTLPNKVLVASAESQLPISRVSIVFGAGSRNEIHESLGATHILRVAGHLTNCCSSGFAVVRNIQECGGNMSIISDREIVAYTVESTSNNIDCVLQYLADVIRPAFKPWELEDSIPLLKYQCAGLTSQFKAVELLHKAAYRTGLGNPLYIPDYKIGHVSSETMMHYAANNLTAGRCAVVGVGIDQNTLAGFAQSLELPTGGQDPTPAKYYSGCARRDHASRAAHVAVAGEGGSYKTPKDVLIHAILKHAYGALPVTKYGKINGPFGKAIASAGGDNIWVSYSALNACYADSGLFGFVVSSDAKNIRKIVEALTKALKDGAVSADEVKRAKAMLKRSVLNAYATDRALIENMGVEAVLSKKVSSADDVVAAIDSITEQEVQAAAKKVGSSKLSIGAVGNLAHVPYGAELNN